MSDKVANIEVDDDEYGLKADGHFTMLVNGKVAASKKNLITNAGINWLTRRLFIDYDGFYTNGDIGTSSSDHHPDYRKYPWDIYSVSFGSGTTSPTLNDTGLEQDFSAINDPEWLSARGIHGQYGEALYVYPKPDDNIDRVIIGRGKSVRINYTSESFCNRRDARVGAWAVETTGYDQAGATTGDWFRELDISATEQSFEVNAPHSQGIQRLSIRKLSPSGTNYTYWSYWAPKLTRYARNGSDIDYWSDSEFVDGAKIAPPDDADWPNFVDFPNYVQDANQYVVKDNNPVWGSDYYAEIYSELDSVTATEIVRIIGWDNQFQDFSLGSGPPYRGWEDSSDGVSYRPRMVVLRGQQDTVARAWPASDKPRIKLLPNSGTTSITYRFQNYSANFNKRHVTYDEPEDGFKSDGSPQTLETYGNDQTVIREAVMLCKDNDEGSKAFSRIVLDDDVVLDKLDLMQIYWKIEIS